MNNTSQDLGLRCSEDVLTKSPARHDTKTPKEDFYHVIGVLEDFHRKQTRLQEKKTGSLTVLGIAFICFVASVLAILTTPSYLALFSFLIPISCYVMGMSFLYFRYVKKDCDYYKRGIRKLSKVLWKDLLARNDFSDLQDYSLKVRIKRTSPNLDDDSY